MRMGIARAVAAIAASVAVSTIGVTGAGAWASGAGAGRPLADHKGAQAPLSQGDQLWVSRYNGPVNGYSQAVSVAVSPTGGTVFVTGYSLESSAAGYRYATIAYNAATGAQVWARRYAGPTHGSSEARSLAVSPNGQTVFVTGDSQGKSSSGTDYATVAYNAATGAQQWARRYHGPSNRSDGATSVAVSRSGRTVFVTGYSADKTSRVDYATIAYNAVTGAQLWIKRYNAPPRGQASANSVAVSPSGRSVFVTGYTAGANGLSDYATVAYNAATGTRLWVRRYNGPGNGIDLAYKVAVSPRGGIVYVTGTSAGTSSSYLDYATIAYNAATGAQLWVNRYNGPGNEDDWAYAVAVSPTGGTVYVTGSSNATATGDDYTTIAYDAATGAQLWIRDYNGTGTGNGGDAAFAIAVSPASGTVYVTGGSAGATAAAEYATVAYSG